VLHFVADSAGPWGLVGEYLEALAAGSYLALSHATYDRLPPHLVRASTEVYAGATQDWRPRSLAEVERFFSGLQIVPPYRGAEPVITHLGVWGSQEPESADSAGSHWWFGGVARRRADYSGSASRS
jgi:hypothetical protein